MKKSLLVASTFLFGISGLAMAGDHPSFTDADTDGNGTLDIRELKAAVPELEIDEAATTIVTAKDIKQVMPEVDFTDEDVVNAAPIREEQYQHIVDAVAMLNDNNAVTRIE